MTLVLGIETSCDETGAAVVENGRRILSNVVASQIDLHKQYGGVFPEIASRQHILTIVPVIQQAMRDAGVDWRDLDAIAVTYGPGLAGSLLVGVNVAKALAFAHDIPLVGVNHIEAHVYANWLAPTAPAPTDLGSAPPQPVEPPAPPPEPQFPLLALIVSGGHTELLLMTDHGQFKRLGATIDDAAGEAFDKVARLLGLGFPGGPAIQQAASRGSAEAFQFPRAWLKGTYDFSFSGLKTAVLRTVRKYEAKIGAPAADRKSKLVSSQTPPLMHTIPVPHIAASFQAAVVDVLVEKTRQAAEATKARQVLLAGGVAANALLRKEMTARLAPVPVLVPPPALCTDNAAPIASLGYFRFTRGERAGHDLDVNPNLRLGVAPAP
ncbi:MAG: tRNA (adenosine(37)-N6)-threonylcarbamoyltransferase complex transferase subunit TsaD [Anaerolineales bacterium]